MSKITDIPKWRTEIVLAEKFRDEEFGKCDGDEKTKAGENMEYYERGFAGAVAENVDMITTVNMIDALISIVVPALYHKNPKTVSTPLKIASEETAPIVAHTVDHFRKKADAEETNQRVIFDAYLFNFGIYKIGYATKFGTDIEDKEKREEKKSAIDRGLEAIGLKKKTEEEIIRPELDIRIEAEAPFISHVSPFDFLIDPRAKNINQAQWMAHSVRKTVKYMKGNKKYKNTALLKGQEVDVTTLDFDGITEAEQEDFATVNLHEIHYRNDNKMYLLVLSQDGSNEWREHYHDESIYELGEWQFDILKFKGHGHSLYARSDITKVKNLQDRITTTIDSILEQVDKFVPKLAVDQNGVTPAGKQALKHGGIGALVETQRSPNDVFKELNFTQLKTDLQALIDQMIGLVTIQTGLTRAQLIGVSSADTATEAQIQQSGSSLRLSDMAGTTTRFINRQSNKLWKIIRQFVTLEELELINGAKGLHPQTGLPMYDWLTVDTPMAEKMQEGEYDFGIEVGSTEKLNLNVVRKAFENLFNILARTEVVAIIQQQGNKLDIAEVLRRYFDLFPELGIDSSKIIQQIQQNDPNVLPPDIVQQMTTLTGPGGTTAGSNENQLRAQQGESAPNDPQILSQI